MNSARGVAIQFVALAAFCTLVGSLAILVFGITGPGQTGSEFGHLPFIDMWVRWDAGWYRGIVLDGYSYSPTAQSHAAYFPLYPMLMWPWVRLGIPADLVGIFVTFTAGLLGSLAFSAWVERVRPGQHGLALRLLLVWPFAYYLAGALYADAMFFACTAAAFLFIERRVLWLSVLFAALASAARPVGWAAVIGLVVREFELTRREGKSLSLRNAVPLLGGFGLAAYMLFLQLKFGDALAFIHTQVGWGQLTGDGAFKPALAQAKNLGDLVSPGLHLALCLAALAAAWPMRRTLGWGYAAYVAVVLAVPLYVARDFIGLGRYALAAFPSFVVFADVLTARPRLKIAWFATSLVLLAIMTTRFAVGRYVS